MLCSSLYIQNPEAVLTQYTQLENQLTLQVPCEPDSFLTKLAEEGS